MQASGGGGDGAGAEKYAAMSRRYMERAERYLRGGDRIQASEKGWGAVAGAVKSVAAERGWNHHSHRLLNDVAEQLATEWGRSEVRFLFDTGERLHVNFYEDLLGPGEIGARLDSIKVLLETLETLRGLPPRAVAVRSREQRNRWRRLTGEALPLAPGGAGLTWGG